MIKISKILSKIAFSLLIIAMLLAVAIIAVVKNKPLFIRFANKIIEQQFVNFNLNINSKIENIVLLWDKNNCINLTLQNFSINDTSSQNNKLAFFPNIDIQLNLKNMFYRTGFFMNFIKVSMPEIEINFKKIKATNSDSNLNNVLKPLLLSKYIEILDGKIAFIKQDKTYNFLLDTTILNKIDDDEKVIFETINKLYFDQNKMEMQAQALINKEGEGDYKILVTELPLIFFEEISADKMNPDATTIDKIKADFNINKTGMNLTKLIVSLNSETNLQIWGSKLWATNSQESENKFNININNMSVSYIKDLWPNQYFAYFKDFFNYYIKDGVIENLTFEAEFKDHDFVNIKFSGNANVKNFTVNYVDGFPTIKNLNAELYVDNNEIKLKAENTAMLNSTIKNVNLNIPLNVSNPTDYQMQVSGNAIGPAIDLVEFVPLSALEDAKEDNIDLKLIKGTAKTNIDIKIPLKENINFEDIKFNINADLLDINLVNLPFNCTLDEGNFTLRFNGPKAWLKGKGKINDNIVNIEWTGHLDEKAEHDVVLNINANIPAQNANFIKIMDEKIVKNGHIILDSKLTSKNNIVNITNKIDFKNSYLKIEKLNIEKKIDNEALLSSNVKIDDKVINIDNFLFKAENLEFAGKMQLNKPNYSLDYFNLDYLHIDQNKFKAKFFMSDKGKNFEVIGKYLDLSKINFENFKSKDKKSQPLKDLKLVLKFDELLMKNKVLFKNFSSDFYCNSTSCLEGDLYLDIISPKHSAHYVHLKLVPKNQYSTTILLDTDNAAVLFKGLDIYDNISGGTLAFYALKTYDPKEKTNDLKGKLLIKNFTVINAPVLSKLITFSSVPGLLHVLDRQAIPFRQLDTDIITDNYFVRIKNGTIAGPQLSLTMDGYLNTDTNRLYIEGNLIPDLYFINKTLSSVPLIGYILRGGKRDQGIFAAQYNIKGAFEKTEVSVNPLSLITPGFLRNIFNIFSSKERQAMKH